jgi:hypothetical protein
VRTLGEANALMRAAYPTPGSDLGTWLTFFRRSAALYAETAVVDPAHRDHTLYWANRERQHADEVEALIAATKARGGTAAVEAAARNYRGGKRRDAATLSAATALLDRERPSKNAAAELWLTYHERAALLYADVAEIDRWHHHQALCHASRERTRAEEARAAIAQEPSDQRGQCQGEGQDNETDRAEQGLRVPESLTSPAPRDDGG